MSESDLTRFLDALPVPAVYVEPGGALGHGNTAALTLLEGVTLLRPEQALYVATVVDADNRLEGRHPITACLKDQTPTRALLKMGSGRKESWIDARCSPYEGGVLCVLTDQTHQHESQRTDDVLRAAEQMARLGGWAYEVETRRIYWSEEVRRIHEVGETYMPTPEGSLAFYAREWQPAIFKGIRQALEGEPFVAEAELVTARGNRCWVYLEAQPMMQDGICVRLLGSLQDITRRKRIEIELQTALRQSQKYAALFDGANALLAIATPDGRFTELNQAWTRTLGYSLETLCSKPFLEFVHPDDLEATLRELEAFAAEPGRLASSFSNRYRAADGRLVWLNWRSMMDEEAGLIYAVAHDITDERQFQWQLDRLAMIARHTSNAVIITDVEGRVEWVNDAFTRMAGYTLEEIEGRKPVELLTGPETQPEVVGLLQRELSQGEGFTTERINHRKDGSAYRVAIESHPMRDDRGVMMGYMSIETDITEKRAAEAELITAREAAERLAEEALEANRAKSEFLAMMSHELRTPMNGVLGTTELLSMTTLTPAQRELLTTIKSSGQALLALLNDILDLSRIEAGRMELTEAPFRLRTVVEEVVALLKPAAAQQGLPLVVEVAAGCPETVLGDALRFRQVLMNLVGNAVKFTERGQVLVEVECTACTGIRVSVHDTGVGIHPDAQRSLFEPFKQADTSARRRFSGSGLGLAISRQLVELMGGQIGVESVPQVGSTFFFEVPLEAHLDLLESDESQAEGLNRPLERPILLVEDNPTNRLVASRMLERLGCSVVMVEDGASAIERTDLTDFALILMDCHMPNLDGWEATRRIRAREQTTRSRRVPIVALTACAMPEERARCLEAGMDDYLSKPLSLKALAAMVRQWGDRVSSPGINC